MSERQEAEEKEWEVVWRFILRGGGGWKFSVLLAWDPGFQ